MHIDNKKVCVVVGEINYITTEALQLSVKKVMVLKKGINNEAGLKGLSLDIFGCPFFRRSSHLSPRTITTRS